MLAHRLALRNLLRNGRRSAFTAAVIVLTMALLTCFQGLSDGGHQAMVQVGVRMGLGDYILSQQDHLNDPSLQHLIGDAAHVEAQVRQASQGLASQVVPRLRLSAMVQAGPNTVAVMASGVDSRVEEQVSGIADARAIVHGRPLSAASAASHHDLPPVVLGERLSKALDVRVGDRITLTVKPRDGQGFSRAAFEVGGIFRTGMQELDAFWVELPLSEAQKLAGVDDHISQLALYLPRESLLPALQTRLAALRQGLLLRGQSWNEAAPELNAAIALDAAGMSLLMLIVIVVVVAGVLNTVLMSALKRHREFGVMLALGGSPSLVVRVVLLEALYLAGFSLLLGLSLGYAAHLYFATVGLNFREVFGSNLEAGGVLLPERFYSSLAPLKLLAVAGTVLLLTLIVSAWPAFKSGRLNPIETLNHA